MTQQLTRFLLQTMADDYRTKSPVPSAMEQVYDPIPWLSVCQLITEFVGTGNICFDHNQMLEL